MAMLCKECGRALNEKFDKLGICNPCLNKKLQDAVKDIKEWKITVPVPNIVVNGDFIDEPFLTEEEFISDCRMRSTDHSKCALCEFRFKCWSQKPRSKRKEQVITPTVFVNPPKKLEF